jgi:hypothetical protein
MISVEPSSIGDTSGYCGNFSYRRARSRSHSGPLSIRYASPETITCASSAQSSE